jgi:GNAT superfamily N-acetyltransferase
MAGAATCNTWWWNRACGGRGIGRELVNHSLDALAADGVLKSHIYIQLHNDGAEAFWRSCGWFLRDDIKMFSHVHGSDPDV